VLFLPVKDNSFDTVLCNQVLEHVPEPQHLFCEITRVLKTGGILILTAPHIWELHEVPHDYYRFTPYGLRYLAEKAGLKVVKVQALAGFWVTAGARFCYYLARFDRGVLAVLIKPLLLAVQLGALFLDRLHRVESEAWNFLLIAKK
jgi:ubiquinone/menaquinone biosynthesis C-methylase UbiE